MEYERRFRLSDLPPGLSGPRILIRQVYWTLGNGWVLRLRRTGDPHQLDVEVAIKGPRHGMGRTEIEFQMRRANSDLSLAELSRTAGELYRAANGRQVVKTRHSYIDELGEPWDIDEFHLQNEGLVIAEIERPTPDEIERIAMPRWALEEVTDDRRYDNERLAFKPYVEW